MTLTVGPNAGLLINGAAGEQHYTELMKQWRGLDGLIHCHVKSLSLTAPAGGEANGDMYIPAAGSTGPWAGKDGQLARYFTVGTGAPGWEFYVPKNGWRAAVEDEAVDYRHNGTSWFKQPTAQSDGSFAVDGPMRITTTTGISDGGTAPALIIDANSSETDTTLTFPHITYINQDQTNGNLIKVGFSDSASGGALVANMTVTITDHSNNYGQYSFWTRGPGGLTEKITIEEDGNVGIGVTNPGEKLEVGGTIKTTAIVIVGSYTVATLPSAAANADGIIKVSDETGGDVLAFSDGTDWRRVTDRAIVS